MSYVYKRSEPGLYTVGFYDPDGKWEPESDHDNAIEAAKRVAWLNGESSDDRLRIVAVAVRIDDLLLSMPAPRRHHAIVHAMTGLGLPQPRADAQGFLLSDGSYAWRRPALHVATRAGQLIRKPTAPAHGLFSEGRLVAVTR